MLINLGDEREEMKVRKALDTFPLPKVKGETTITEPKVINEPAELKR